MTDKFQDSVIALAGAIQACRLVKNLAHSGQVDKQYFTASIQSIYQLNPTTAIEIYGNFANLHYGLQSLVDLFKVKDKAQFDRETSSYFFALIYLERKLAKNSAMMTTLSKRLTQVKEQAEYFHSTHENVIANLADIYTSTISTFNFRIQVLGSEQILSHPDNTNKVRALLLSGIRAIVLWRQSKGNRLHFIFKRKQICRLAEKLLQLDQQPG